METSDHEYLNGGGYPLPITRDDNGQWWLALPETATVHDIARCVGQLYGEDEREAT